MRPEVILKAMNVEQHENPCTECAFRRDIVPGLLGGSPPETYIGQLLLPFWIPCHCQKNYRSKATVYGQVAECAGAAIMRANLGIRVPRPMLRLPSNPKLVFATFAEFYAHHKQIPIEEAQKYLTQQRVGAMMMKEWLDPNVKIQAKIEKD